MISKDILQLVTLSIIVTLAIVALVLVVYGVAKKKNTAFIVSQLVMAGAFLCVCTIGFYGGVTCEYSGGTAHTDIASIETKRMTKDDGSSYTEYEATTEDGKILRTENIVYGNELQYLSDCKLVKTTAFGFKVYTNDTLLICKPNDENFDTMSESEKESELRKLNNGILVKAD